MNSRERKRIETLERRANHLERRRAEQRTGSSYDLAEEVALRWAIALILEAEARGALDDLLATERRGGLVRVAVEPQMETWRAEG